MKTFYENVLYASAGLDGLHSEVIGFPLEWILTNFVCQVIVLLSQKFSSSHSCFISRLVQRILRQSVMYTSKLFL